LAVIAWFFIPSISAFGQQGVAGPPDAIFFHGKVITVDSNISIQQAFAVRFRT